MKRLILLGLVALTFFSGCTSRIVYNEDGEITDPKDCWKVMESKGVCEIYSCEAFLYSSYSNLALIAEEHYTQCLLLTGPCRPK